MVISIIGPSGSGKSTQAKLLAQKYRLSHFSVGALFRQEIETNSALGQELRPFVDAGKWAPDELALKLIDTNLAKVDYRNLVIDGFPRVLSQGRLFEELLFKNHSTLDQIFHINIPFSAIYARRARSEATSPTGEFSDPGRSDETTETILARQTSYDESILPILDYYAQKNLLTQLDGTPDIDVIFRNLTRALEKLNISKNNNG